MFDPQYDPHKLGIDRILEDQRIFAHKVAKQSWRQPVVFRNPNPGLPATSIPSRPVPEGPGFAESYPRFSKFFLYLSLASLVAGLLIGYLFSSKVLDGWWQLAGVAAGGILGIAAPSLNLLLLGYLAYGFFSLLLTLLDLLWFLLKLLLVGAVFLGILAAIDHFAG